MGNLTILSCFIICEYNFHQYLMINLSIPFPKQTVFLILNTPETLPTTPIHTGKNLEYRKLTQQTPLEALFYEDENLLWHHKHKYPPMGQISFEGHNRQQGRSTTSTISMIPRCNVGHHQF